MRAKVDERLPFVEVALPEPGSRFGPYLVEHPVGQGGFGAVYRARDERLGRTVALKVLLPSEAADPESVARFLREARLAASLEHPNIVRILDVGSIDDTPYIGMEWIDGRTLRHAKIEHPSELLALVAETLAFAHERGIVHRDLKPANVIVDRDGRPKLVDFGIAKRIGGAPATFATRDGTVLGTPDYMAPEQQLTSAVDARADQWSWGAIAYELLTGERPMKPALAHAALDEKASAVIMRALSMAPSDRFATMRDLLAAWKAATAAPEPRAGPRSSAPSPSRMPLFLATTATVTVVASLVIAVVLLRKRDEPPPAPITTENVSSDASTLETLASDAAAEDASVVAAPETLPSATPAKPVVPRVRALVAVKITRSAAVNPDRVSDQLRASRPAFERCVIGVPIAFPQSDLTFEARVHFEEKTGEGHVEFIQTVGGATTGRVVAWPPANVTACLAAVIRKLKVSSIFPGKDSYFDLAFELR
jgi:predicted Ser/Thr protein kinase